MKTFTCTVRGEFQESWGVDFEFNNTSVLKTGFYNFGFKFGEKAEFSRNTGLIQRG